MTTPAAPLISLCMIVKDEADDLARCLESARAVADEIVVYDTGSTDGTQELARSLGAQVHQGTWVNDFAWARNQALRHCTGTWILWLDADEELQVDAQALRAHLSGLRRVDALQVEILNVDAASGEFRHVAERVFRRTRMRWSGALHEVLVRRDAQASRLQSLKGAQILHLGYDAEHVVARDKFERNLDIALAALTQPGASDDMSRRHLNVARSFTMRGDDQASVAHYESAVDLAEGQQLRHALRLLTEALVKLGRYRDAETRLSELRNAQGNERVVEFLDGLIRLRRDADGTALASFDPDTPVHDGTQASTQDLVRRIVAEARATADDWSGSVEILETLVGGDTDAPLWPELVSARLMAGTPANVVLASIADKPLRTIVPSFISLPEDRRGAVAEALRERFGDASPITVAFAAGHAARLDEVEAMVPWAALIRASGLTVPCPVMDRARDLAVEPTRRFLAAATAHAAFGDPGALQALFDISELLRPEEEADAAYILTQIAPDLIVA